MGVKRKAKVEMDLGMGDGLHRVERHSQRTTINKSANLDIVGIRNSFVFAKRMKTYAVSIPIA